MQAHAGKNDNEGSREETRNMGTWNRSRKLWNGGHASDGELTHPVVPDGD